MSGQDWDGDLQRAHLSGFARLRAILWRRSFRLLEWWRLGRFRWYRRLRSQMARQFAGIDVFDARRVKRAAEVFGETPCLTVVSLMERLEASGHPALEPFVDLGCGRGLTCLTAASLGYRAVGFELESSWVQAARRTAEGLELEARFESGDLLGQEWPERGTFLIVATAYPEELRRAILDKLEREVEQALVVTVDWEAKSPHAEPVWELSLPVDWGIATFRLLVFSRTC